MERSLLYASGMQTHCPSRLLSLIALLGLTSLLQPAIAVNSLSIWSVGTHGTFPGYIDEATAVVEPKSGFAAVSLFLDYADHNQFPSKNVEVIHLFELPEGAMVHDLWLWIGDSIMQARIYETPRAQRIYDSITSLRKDPAFLKLKNGQYELHVYPLASGSHRKIKLTYLAPLSWSEGRPRVVLPLRMLQATGAPLKPLRVLCRTVSELAVPPFFEGATQPFKRLPDTLGYSYYESRIDDIGGLSRLDVAIPPAFADGVSRTTLRTDKASYASIGIIPKDFFNLAGSGDAGRKALVGIALDGWYGPTPEQVRIGLAGILPQAIARRDSFKVIVSGGGRLETYPRDGWSAADDLSVLQEAMTGAAASSTEQARERRILMTDPEARHCWGFTDLEKLGDVTYAPARGLMSQLDRFRGAQVVASLTQGYEENLTDAQARQALDTLARFFEAGGLFLTYLDFNRRNEKIATTLIRGLRAPTAWNEASVLKAVPGSPIGRGLPAELHHKSNFVLQHDDPDATAEMVDGRGRPVVISKAIGKGRIVVSGIWALQDADGIKKALALPMLGLQNPATKDGMDTLMTRLADEHGRSPVARILLLGNTDIPRDAHASAERAAGYLGAFAAPRPFVDAIHLQDGQVYIPPGVISAGKTWLGNALELKALADQSGGRYRSLQTSSWDVIREDLRLLDFPALQNLTFSAWTLPGERPATQVFGIAPASSDPRQPRHFMLRAPAAESLGLSFQATFVGLDSVHRRTLTVALESDSSEFGTFLPAALAIQNIDSLLRASDLDTQAVIRLAFDHRLVTDFTALLALEPNDTLRFLPDPKDESSIGKPSTALRPPTPGARDTLGLAFAYSPANRRLTFTISAPSPGRMEAAFFDARGRRIREWRAEVHARGDLVYEMGAGKDAAGLPERGYALVRFTPSPSTGFKAMTKAARFVRP